MTVLTIQDEQRDLLPRGADAEAMPRSMDAAARLGVLR
jgi:hypothetical protein